MSSIHFPGTIFLVDAYKLFCTFVNQTTIMNNNPFPERLRAARKRKGWSLQELAEQLSLSITKQALNKYEAGSMFPSAKILIALGKVLEVKPDYFTRPIQLNLPPVEFRKAASLPVKQIEQVKETVRDVIERYMEVESLLGLKEAFQNPLPNHVIEEIDEVDAYAEILLKKWNLGNNPIPNIIEMLEEHGVRVIEIAGPDSFDGLCTMVGNMAVIVLNQHYTVERKRFTALHELGHLILNIHPDADKEKICHAFAGAVLLPGKTLHKLMGDKRNNIAPAELINIKEQYGISVQAIMMRAKLLGIISDATANRFFRQIAKNKKEEGWGNYKGIEKTYRFEQLVYRLAAEEVVSMSKAASLAGLSLAAFKERIDGR
jgi:Zn-dependent peptidase ImmA (M78 family)/DNA-binding XRE family transcriptional regulator